MQACDHEYVCFALLCVIHASLPCLGQVVGQTAGIMHYSVLSRSLKYACSCMSLSNHPSIPALILCRPAFEQDKLHSSLLPFTNLSSVCHAIRQATTQLLAGVARTSCCMIWYHWTSCLSWWSLLLHGAELRKSKLPLKPCQRSAAPACRYSLLKPVCNAIDM